jgi:hypothetical protein
MLKKKVQQLVFETANNQRLTGGKLAVVVELFCG